MTRSSSGTVTKMKGRDLWVGRFQLDGKRRAVYAKTMKECQAKLRDAYRLAESGVVAAPSAVTVGRYLDEWLETSVRNKLRPATIRSYESAVAKHLKPAIGSVPLVKLEPRHIERMLSRMSHLSGTSRHYYLTVLRTALGKAYRLGLVVRNVAALVDAPKKAERDVRPLDRTEVTTLRESTRGDRHEALYVVAITSGLRQGELLGLRWQDVNVETGTIEVRHTLSKFGRTLSEPKTKASRRAVKLPPSTLALLRQHRASQKVVRLGDDYVFTTRTGKPLNARDVLRSFTRALARAGIEHRRFHDLRHTYATLLLGQGVDIAVVSKALGHSSISTTADVYSHWTKPMQEQTASAIEAALSA